VGLESVPWCVPVISKHLNEAKPVSPITKKEVWNGAIRNYFIRCESVGGGMGSVITDRYRYGRLSSRYGPPTHPSGRVQAGSPIRQGAGRAAPPPNKSIAQS